MASVVVLSVVSIGVVLFVSVVVAVISIEVVLVVPVEVVGSVDVASPVDVVVVTSALVVVKNSVDDVLVAASVVVVTDSVEVVIAVSDDVVIVVLVVVDSSLATVAAVATSDVDSSPPKQAERFQLSFVEQHSSLVVKISESSIQSGMLPSEMHPPIWTYHVPAEVPCVDAAIHPSGSHAKAALQHLDIDSCERSAKLQALVTANSDSLDSGDHDRRTYNSVSGNFLSCFPSLIQISVVFFAYHGFSASESAPSSADSGLHGTSGLFSLNTAASRSGVERSGMTSPVASLKL